jgi:hypothetical protein
MVPDVMTVMTVSVMMMMMSADRYADSGSDSGKRIILGNAQKHARNSDNQQETFSHRYSPV